jgi:hypothetical protein
MSCCKIISHSVFRVVVFLEEASRARQRKGGILLGSWSVRSLYSAGSLTAAVRELARYNLYLVNVQDFMWE